MSDHTPEEAAAEQRRQQQEMLENLAREARRVTERLDRQQREGATRLEREAEQQARREAEALRLAAEIDRRLKEFTAQHEQDAREAERRKREREIAEEARGRSGDVADAHGRYAEALGQHYDIRDPYGSLGRAAMAEYGAFNRQQQQLAGGIAREADPEKRKLLELRKEIEANDYMAITSERLAGISRVVTGRNDNEHSRRDAGRAKEFRDRARELREERQELIRQRLEREAGDPGQRPGEGRGLPDPNDPGGSPQPRGPAPLPRDKGPQQGQRGDGAPPGAARDEMMGQPAQQIPQHRERQGLPAPGTQAGTAAGRTDEPARDQIQQADRPAARGRYGVLRDPAEGGERAETSRDQQQQSEAREARAAPGKAADPADKMANVEMTDRRATALAKIRERHGENAERTAQREQNRQMGRSPGGRSR